MDNKFFQFVEKYWQDISAFFKAFIAFVEALFGKLNADGETTEEA